MAVSMPISVSMIFACLSYFIASHGDIGIICHKIMYNTYNSYVIIAVPLFIFMANVMNAGQVTDILFEFSKACIGKRRGALAHVNALLSLIFAGMSGSAVADASGIGTIEIAAMKKDGYDDEFSCCDYRGNGNRRPGFSSVYKLSGLCNDLRRFRRKPSAGRDRTGADDDGLAYALCRIYIKKTQLSCR